MVRANLSMKLWRRKRKFMLSFAAAPQTSEVMNTVHKGLVKMKKALNLRGHIHLTFTRVCCYNCSILFSSVQLLSHVWLFTTPWTAAHQASLSITNSRSLLKLMSIKSVMPSNHLIVIPFFACLQSLPTSGSFLTSQFFTLGGQSIGVSISASVLPMNIQDWFPLGLTGLISYY